MVQVGTVRAYQGQGPAVSLDCPIMLSDGTIVAGWHDDARSCLLVLATVRVRSLRSGSRHSTSFLFSRCTVESVTPLAPRSTSVPLCRHRLLLHAPHIPLRGMFVAVDRARA